MLQPVQRAFGPLCERHFVGQAPAGCVTKCQGMLDSSLRTRKLTPHPGGISPVALSRVGFALYAAADRGAALWEIAGRRRANGRCGESAMVTTHDQPEPTKAICRGVRCTSGRC